MTPREKAVVQKAIEWRRAIPGRSRDLKLTIDLEQAIWDLIVSCDACNYGGHLCPGCGTDVPHGDIACADCNDSPPNVYPPNDERAGEPVSAGQLEQLEQLRRELAGLEPEWLPLTMQHVRPGDRVRPAGSTDPGAEIMVTDRYWPPTNDARGRGSWHIVAGEKHWDDHVVQHGECAVELNGDGRIRFLPPEMKIEVFMAPAEHSAIEALGWDNRLTSQ